MEQIQVDIFNILYLTTNYKPSRLETKACANEAGIETGRQKPQKALRRKHPTEGTHCTNGYDLS
jgi:hypothetical protein